MPERISLTMDFVEALTVMAEGNPGAINALIEMTKAAPKADPDSALDAWGPILLLDSWNIYGSNIWLLYKDLCRQDAVNVLAVLRACQLGLLPSTSIGSAIAATAVGGLTDPRFTIDGIAKIRAKVKDALPNFDRQPTTSGE